MFRISLALLALSLLTLAPEHVLTGGCGGGRMSRMQAVAAGIDAEREAHHLIRGKVRSSSAPSLRSISVSSSTFAIWVSM